MRAAETIAEPTAELELHHGRKSVFCGPGAGIEQRREIISKKLDAIGTGPPFRLPMSAAIVSENFRGAGKLGDHFPPHCSAKRERMNQREAGLSGIRINSIPEMASILRARD